MLLFVPREFSVVIVVIILIVKDASSEIFCVMDKYANKIETEFPDDVARIIWGRATRHTDRRMLKRSNDDNKDNVKGLLTLFACIWLHVERWFPWCCLKVSSVNIYTLISLLPSLHLIKYRQNPSTSNNFFLENSFIRWFCSLRVLLSSLFHVKSIIFKKFKAPVKP